MPEQLGQNFDGGPPETQEATQNVETSNIGKEDLDERKQKLWHFREVWIEYNKLRDNFEDLITKQDDSSPDIYGPLNDKEEEINSLLKDGFTYLDYDKARMEQAQLEHQYRQRCVDEDRLLTDQELDDLHQLRDKKYEMIK